MTCRQLHFILNRRKCLQFDPLKGDDYGRASGFKRTL